MRRRSRPTLLPLALGLLVAGISGLLGLVPNVVEPAGSVDPVSCGPTWFRPGGLPSDCYVTDWLAVAAQAGLALATILALVSLVAWAAESFTRCAHRREQAL
jgi:hypothetical protein